MTIITECCQYRCKHLGDYNGFSGCECTLEEVFIDQDGECGGFEEKQEEAE